MHWKAVFRFLETKQVEPGELLYNSGAPALMFSGDTPGDDHFPGLLSGTEDPPIVFGADRIYFPVKSVGIGRHQPEQICHDKPIISPRCGKGPNASKCWIEPRFICEAWIQADPGAQPWCKKRLPCMYKPIPVSSIKTKNAVVLHGVCFLFSVSPEKDGAARTASPCCISFSSAVTVIIFEAP
jgi:hypothetical protein